MAKQLWVERREDGNWEGHSSEGASIVIGHSEGMFNPGDLMKIALAACGSMSSHMPVERVLGENKGARIEVSGDYDDDNDRYNSFSEKVIVDASDKGLNDEDARKLEKRIRAHIEKDCTVMHTYIQRTPVDIEIEIKH